MAAIGGNGADVSNVLKGNIEGIANSMTLAYYLSGAKGRNMSLDDFSAVYLADFEQSLGKIQEYAAVKEETSRVSLNF